MKNVTLKRHMMSIMFEVYQLSYHNSFTVTSWTQVPRFSTTLPQRGVRLLRWNRCVTIVVWWSTQCDRDLDILILHPRTDVGTPHPTPRSRMYTGESVITTQTVLVCLSPWDWCISLTDVCMSSEIASESVLSPSLPSSLTHVHRCMTVYRLSEHKLT